MPLSSVEQLFNAIAFCTKPSELAKVLSELGDKPELKVEEKFGSQNYQWRFYGERDSNISTINISSKPTRSIVERITNAIDAILEREMEVRGGMAPTSPMEAAKVWFSRPPSTNDSGIFSWGDFGHYDYDKNVAVTLLPADEELLPTIDVKDNGIGIQADDFYNTILSLQKGIKLTKKYLSGAFGQGGSQTLTYSKYTVIISRRNGSNQIAFTVIKKMHLPEEYGEDAFVYLALSNAENKPTVPFVTVTEDFNLYPQVETALHDKIRLLSHGTVVRHVGYRLEGSTGKFGPAPGNLYHLLNYLLFDPILPFRVLDFRDLSNIRNELITGSRNRLMANKAETWIPGDTGTEIKTYSPREMISPLEENNPCVALEYWIAYNWRKTNEKIVLRSKSNALFIDENHPIIGTLNGQNQGEQTFKIFKDVGLQMVGKHAIIHIDASRATKSVRTNLFASTREGFKDDQALKEIMDILKNMLQEDEVLFALEKELMDKLLESETKETDAEVRKEITSLLLDAGFQGRVEGLGSEPGDGDEKLHRERRKKPKPHPIVPLATLPWPNVTYFNIVYPIPQLEIPKESHRVIKVETDANFRYDRESRISLRFVPDVLEIASLKELNGGRKQWRVKCKSSLRDLSTGKVIATLTKPNGEQLTSEIPFIVEPAMVLPSKQSKGLVPEFKIQQVAPEQDKFQEVWPDIEPDKVDEVAYRYIKSSDNKIVVFYNTHFDAFKRQVDLLQKNVGLLSLFIKNYEIWIGYHSILQQQEGSGFEDEPNIERIQERERAVVAEMQVKQALKTSKLQQENLQSKEAVK